MISDLRQMGDGIIKNVDLCIIGAGAAGISLAQSFAGNDVQVCLVESGGLHFEEDTQKLYAGSSVGQPMDMEAGRVRQFGGSTNHWGGRCAELGISEIAQRPWIPFSGWPLGLKELEPYYSRARQVCGFSAEWGSVEDVVRLLGLGAFPNLTSAAATQVWRFAPDDSGSYRNFGKVFYQQLRRASNIDVVLHANLTEIHTNPASSHVDEITVRSLSGVSGKISARYFVLCCGGIENARLLMTAKTDSSVDFLVKDSLGRFFMEHGRALAATVYTTDRYSRLQDVFNEFTGVDGIRYQVGLVLSEKAQREEKLLNCSTIFVYNGDPESGSTAAQELWYSLRSGHWPDGVGEDVWRIVRDMSGFESNVERRLLHGRPPLLPLSSVSLVVDVEQAPESSSRIFLDDRRDALGLRKAVVDWRLSEVQQRTVRYFMTELGIDFARRGVGRLRLEPWLEVADGSWKHELAETFHYIGSTRMSRDPSDGVVDVNCRMHGVDNLFVGGSSVFPTGGHVNPTLTITALAIRLADHLTNLLG